MCNHIAAGQNTGMKRPEMMPQIGRSILEAVLPALLYFWNAGTVMRMTKKVAMKPMVPSYPGLRHEKPESILKPDNRRALRFRSAP